MRNIRFVLVSSLVGLMLLACSFTGGAVLPTPTKHVLTISTAETGSAPAEVETPTLVIPLPFLDTFDSIQNGWPTGLHTGVYADRTYSAVNGKFHVLTTAKKVAFVWAYPDVQPLANFTIEVEGQLVSGKEEDNGYGIVFLAPSGTKKYLFEVSNDSYGVYYDEDATGWQDIVKLTSDAAVLPGKVNHLKVVGANGYYTFYVNGTKMYSFTDNRIPEGQLGLACDLFTAGETAEFEFDNFSVTRP
jgi:hypothetical protein